MLKTRVIPVLLMKDNGLYKGVKFKNHRYVGDPINAVKIFNEKEVDELVLLDIEASVLNKEINFKLLEDIVSEAFMPLAYGGGIKSVEDAKSLFRLGIEKIVLNTTALSNKGIIEDIVSIFGSQSVVFSLDIKKTFWGNYCVYSKSGTIKIKHNVLEICKAMENIGVGEIIINSIDRDGCMEGYDLEIINTISSNLSIPTVACGGASGLQDFQYAIDYGAHAVAAGSMFVYSGVHKAVLISYPKYDMLCDLFK